MLNFLIDASVVIAFYLFPVLLLLLFVSPFIVLKLRHKKFTILNIIASLLIGATLVALTLYATYWGIAYLQGLAFIEYHGFN